MYKNLQNLTFIFKWVDDYIKMFMHEKSKMHINLLFFHILNLVNLCKLEYIYFHYFFLGSMDKFNFMDVHDAIPKKPQK